jgi:hypothetical protein
MKAVVLDGSRKGENELEVVRRVIARTLGELQLEVEVLELRNLKMIPCMGCFDCWLKTPGMCLYKDDAREVTGKILQSDLMVFVTPVTFGGYSSLLKCALDRSLGMMLPYFQRIDGKTHHKKRYPRYPRLMAVGVLPAPDAEGEGVFHELVSRNAINAHSPSHASEVFIDGVGEEEVEQSIQCLLAKVGVTV